MLKALSMDSGEIKQLFWEGPKFFSWIPHTVVPKFVANAEYLHSKNNGRKHLRSSPITKFTFTYVLYCAVTSG